MSKDTEPRQIQSREGSFKNPLDAPTTYAEARIMTSRAMTDIHSIKTRGVTLGKYKHPHR